MENLAYLHLAFTYEDNELYTLSSLFQNAVAPDWKKLSGQAWKSMLTLALIVSIGSIFYSTCNNVLALEPGDQGPSVKNLQQKLKAAGFYQAPITQVYDLKTETAVRHFQKAAGLPTSGVVEPDTLNKLADWRTKDIHKTNLHRSTTNISKKTKIIATNSISPEPAEVDFLQKGAEGPRVSHLQTQLRVAGFYYGNPTGIFGPITEEAVKRFQKAYKLRADGVVGATTMAKLSVLDADHVSDIPKDSSHQDSLNIGDRGESVRILQEELAKAGYLTGQPNGYYGSHTADAVRRFQKKNHLEVTGMAEPNTRARLFNLVKTSPKSDFHVLEIQRRLQERGFYKGQLNGVMADNTKKAIKSAQDFYGISLIDFKNN